MGEVSYQENSVLHKKMRSTWGLMAVRHQGISKETDASLESPVQLQKCPVEVLNRK